MILLKAPAISGSEANLDLLHSHYIPEWMQDENGVSEQKRVWEDIVRKLEASGHQVEIPKVQANKS